MYTEGDSILIIYISVALALVWSIINAWLVLRVKLISNSDTTE